MDIKKLLEEHSLSQFPAGLGGCKNNGPSYECCEYNVTVFDNKNENDFVVEFENELAKIHHGSLEETKSEILVQYYNMKVITDEQWDLKMFLSKIKTRKEKIFKNFLKDSLIDSLFYVTRSKQALKNSDPFSSCWQKCAAYFLADAISASNMKRPSPAHMLEDVRGFENNRINEKFSIINDCIGMERATPSLLSRMCKSTMGFSDMIEKNNHSKIIQAKHDYLVKNSLLSDCYFYLGYINRNNIIRIKNTLSKRQDLIHVLKVGFDIENDATKVEQQGDLLAKTATEILSNIDA